MDIDYIKRLKSIFETSESDFVNDIILNELVMETTYPTIIMDKKFNILFMNEPLLRLYEMTFEKTFMKNYLGVVASSEEEFYLIKDTYDKIIELKKPLFLDSEEYHSYIHIFPILSPKTGEVVYFQNVYVVGEKHLEPIKSHEVNFNNDYVLFAHQLSVLLATKDRYTAQHSSNVSKYAALLGTEIGIEKSELEMLRVAGSLHDIGKISIPNTILNKKDKLTSDEREIIKKHSIYSSKILSGLKLHELSDHGKISEVGLYHHEWYDGTGYPLGLAGDEIPLTARLITLVDAFDAMTTNRPYRDAMPVKDAINELLVHSGTHFDPYLVHKFVNLDLENEVKMIGEFDKSYADDYTIPRSSVDFLRNNLEEIFSNIDPYDILKNLCDNNIYGLIISEYAGGTMSDSGCCLEIMYKTDYFDSIISDKYIDDDFAMCFRKGSNMKCGYCQVKNCIATNNTVISMRKIENESNKDKYINTLVYPVYDNVKKTSLVIEIVKDNTIEQSYSRDSNKEFFAVTRSLTDLFAVQDNRFYMISSNMDILANWIASKIEISGIEIELLNKAISICDLGIIPLLDSNEYSFDSIEELRHNDKHINVIDDLLMSIESFKDVKEIVMYHHTSYSDLSKKLCMEQVPIQSYIISLTDFLLTDIVIGRDIDKTLKFVEKMSKVIFSPRICSTILEPNNRKELLDILNVILVQLTDL